MFEGSKEGKDTRGLWLEGAEAGPSLTRRTGPNNPRWSRPCRTRSPCPRRPRSSPRWRGSGASRRWWDNLRDVAMQEI